MTIDGLWIFRDLIFLFPDTPPRFLPLYGLYLYCDILQRNSLHTFFLDFFIESAHAEELKWVGPLRNLGSAMVPEKITNALESTLGGIFLSHPPDA